ncbi:MAG: hypothetical protein VXZ05_03655, partial [Pseudomonadota bacterium]|nr:hypothetical protein [Pseudomonadota bacterium]
ANGVLAGSANADSFDVTGGAITANAIEFTNLNSAINAGEGAGDDADSLTGGDTEWTLTGIDKQLNSGSFQFSGIDTADLNSTQLVGTGNADTFDVTGTNTLTAADIDFTEVASVDAAGGRDTVNTNGNDASLIEVMGTAVTDALTSVGIVFTATEKADLGGDLGNGTLSGSSAADSFDVTGGAITGNGIEFTNLNSAINAGEGTGDDADSLTGGDTEWTLTGTDKQLNSANFQFSGIDTADLNSTQLVGTGNADTFDVTGTNALSAAEIAFTEVASVNAGDGSDTVNTNAATLSGGNYALITRGINFTALENANLSNGQLAGTGNADTFNVTSANKLNSNAISFTEVGSVDAAGGSDTVNTDFASLSGESYGLVTRAINFTALENANLNGGLLGGTRNADTFNVTGENELNSNSISFTEVGSVNANFGSDEVNTNAATLTGTDGELITQNISFEAVENANLSSGQLVGTGNADTFDVTGTNALTSAEIAFTQVGSVNAAGGSDTVNTDNAEMSGTAYEVDTQGITFEGVENVALSGTTSGTVTGTENGDNYSIDGNEALTADSIAFTGVNTVNAGIGADNVTTNNNDASLVDSVVKALASLGITFNEVETAALGTGTLSGSGGNDSFEVTGAAITGNGVSFTSLNSAVNAEGGADSVIVNDALATLNGTNALNTANYQFTGVELAELNNGQLVGTANADTFDVTGANTLTAADISFIEVASVNTAGGSDTVTTNNAALSGTAYEVDTQSITFEGVETVALSGDSSGTVTGTNNGDEFGINTVNGDTVLTVDSIAFTGVTTVNAGDGADNVTTNNNDASLVDSVVKALASLGITFNEVETAALGTGSLSGSDGNDSFEVTGAAITGNGVSFSSLNSAINAGANADSVTVNDVQATLNGTNALNTASYQFTGVESADLNSGQLVGTANADTFNVTGANALTAADIDFTEVASVNAGNGDDAVNTNAATLTGTDGELTTQNISFSAVETADLASGVLEGSANADRFDVTGSAITGNGIAFTNLDSAINAGEGTGDDGDSLTGGDTAWTLTGTDKQLNSESFQFSGIDTADLNSTQLIGTGNADTFDVTGTNALTAAEIAFTDVASVNAAGGDDTVNTNGNDASLIEVMGTAVTDALTSLGIVFTATENADLHGDSGNGTLSGSSAADNFVVTGTAITGNGVAFTNLNSAINAGESAGDDADSL